MFAAQILSASEKEFVLGDIDTPRPGPEDVLVEIYSAGLAPGIFNLLDMGSIPLFPTILGHEMAGTVVSVGTHADTDLIGKRVRVHPLLGCGHCEYCTSDRDMMCSSNSMMGHAVFGPNAMPLYSKYHNGGLAEFVVAPQANIDVLPDSISFDLAAKVHDFANAMRALKLAELPPGGTLVVTAATGAMGVATIALARYFGVSKVVALGRNSSRLESVEALDPELITTVTFADEDAPPAIIGAVRAADPAGAHAVIDFLPEGPGLAKVFGAIRYGGRIVHMGMNTAPFPLPQAALAFNCISYIGSRNGTRKDALDATRILAANPGQFERLITHRFKLSEAADAKAQLRSRSEPMWMAVVNPDSKSNVKKEEEE